MTYVVRLHSRRKARYANLLIYIYICESWPITPTSCPGATNEATPPLVDCLKFWYMEYSMHSCSRFLVCIPFRTTSCPPQYWYCQNRIRRCSSYIRHLEFTYGIKPYFLAATNPSRAPLHLPTAGNIHLTISSSDTYANADRSECTQVRLYM
jgi:hypothetical protein